MNDELREKELQVIENVKKLFSSEEGTACLKKMAEQMSPSLKFAMDSSMWEAMARMPKGAKIGKGLPIALLAAAGIRCSKNHCKHVLKDISIPRYAFMAGRILTCDKCWESFKDIVQKNDADVRSGVGRADECDLCLKKSCTWFTQITLAFNGTIFIGNVCDECKLLIKTSGEK